MAWWAAAATVASAWAGNESSNRSAKAQAAALEAQAAAKLKAADSVLYASTLNRTREIEEGRQLQSRQITSFASAGVDITSGSVLDVLKNTEFNILKNDFLSDMEAEAQADQIKAGAAADLQQASAVKANQSANSTANIINAGLSLAKDL